MIPFDEVSEETWQMLSLILGKPSLLADCLAATPVSDAGQESAPAVELERFVCQQIARSEDQFATTAGLIGPRHLAAVQWPFIAQALMKVREAYLATDSFDWTDTTEAALSDGAA